MPTIDPPDAVAIDAGRRPRRWEWWHVAALGLLIVQVAATLIPYFERGRLGLILWMIRGDVLFWWGIGALLGVGALITMLLRRPSWTRRRLVGLGLIAALMAAPMIGLAYPSPHDDRPSDVRFRLPMDGPITVGWGGGTRDVNYHVVAPDQRWAYDLLVARDGRTHAGDGSALTDYYCYDLPVRAPSWGVVRAAFDGDPDMPPGTLGGGRIACGNHVVLMVARDEYLFLCHLKPGSVTVEEGEMVEAGQVVGRVGNSGNTSEPHLHVHLQDTYEPHFGAGIPMPFSDYRVVGGGRVGRGIPTGGFRDGRPAGQVVEHIEAKAEAP